MAEVFVDEANLTSLKGKVVVLAGGAQGIGAAAVTLLYNLGAHVFFGDWDSTKGADLTSKLRADSQGQGSINYTKINIREYQDQVALFDAAMNAHGRVDAAICCAAVGERAGLWDGAAMSLEQVKATPTPIADVIDINLTGTLYFARLGIAYLSHNFTSTQTLHEPKTTYPPPSDFSSPKSLTLLSSVAGFKESPGLFAYSAAKHGVIGLMRALRPFAPSTSCVRVNAVCPWATDTQLLSGVRDAWVKASMPMNTPADVARLVLQIVADRKAHGKAVYVAGGRGFDVEVGINETEPQWLGEQQSKDLNFGQGILGLGTSWGDK